MRLSTKIPGLAGRRMLMRDAVLLVFGAFLLLGTATMFWGQPAALDSRTKPMHAKPVFVAQDSGHVAFKPNENIMRLVKASDAADPKAGSEDILNEEIIKSTNKIVNRSVSNVASSFNKDISFKISKRCSTMMSSASGMAKQWGKARKELGISESLPSDLMKLARRFYSISFGALTISNDGKPLTYVMIWKCANDAIRKNLMSFEDSRPVRNPKRVSQKVLSKRESKSSVEYKKKLSAQFGLDKPPKAFTFAREPISHFISGLSEYYWRNYKQSVISTEELKAKLDGMFAFTQLNERRDSIMNKWQKYILWHFFAMSGILKPQFNIGYLGKLESFEEDWQIVNNLYGTDIKINHSLGWHESSDDPNGVKAAFKDLFKRDIRYKRALCQLLLMDYVCFNYKLPLGCGNVDTASKSL